ncbi:hypothetical protein AKJ16_DCAP16984 [Drosera capensis]
MMNISLQSHFLGVDVGFGYRLSRLPVHRGCGMGHKFESCHNIQLEEPYDLFLDTDLKQFQGRFGNYKSLFITSFQTLEKKNLGFK